VLVCVCHSVCVVCVLYPFECVLQPTNAFTIIVVIIIIVIIFII